MNVTLRLPVWLLAAAAATMAALAGNCPAGVIEEAQKSFDAGDLKTVVDLMAKEVDFFSVGTNDLIQYCLAVDRGNEHVAYLYEPLHPAVLRALQRVCAAGREAGIEVAMCGEMAGEQLYSLVLIGLGFTELSMNPTAISRVKRLLRQVSTVEARALVEQLLQLPTAAEVVAALGAEMGRRFPELFEVPPQTLDSPAVNR